MSGPNRSASGPLWSRRLPTWSCIDEAVVAAHPRELVQHVRLEAARVDGRHVPRERRREQRGRFAVGEARGVGARRRVICRSRTECLERGASLGQHVEERRVVAYLAAGGGLELGQRAAPAGRVERNDGVGTESRPDPKARLRIDERAVLGQRRARGVGRRQRLDPEPVEQGSRSERGRRELLLELRVDRLRRSGVEPLLDPEHRRERLAQPEPGRREREQVHAVGQQLPDGAVVDVGLAEPGSARAARPASRASARRSDRR